MVWRPVALLDQWTDDGRWIDAATFRLTPGDTVPLFDLPEPGFGHAGATPHPLGSVPIRRIGKTVEALLPEDLPLPTPGLQVDRADIEITNHLTNRGIYVFRFCRATIGELTATGLPPWPTLNDSTTKETTR